MHRKKVAEVVPSDPMAMVQVSLWVLPHFEHTLCTIGNVLNPLISVLSMAAISSLCLTGL
jgi:hypothetical protein